MDDRHLIRQALAGDESAYTELYNRHVLRIKCWVMKLSHGSAELIEEVTQLTFIKAFKHLASFKNDCQLSTWLCTIARNELGMLVRKTRAVNYPTEFLGIDDDLLESTRLVFHDLQLLGTADRMLLEQLIPQMPEGYRRVFILRAVYGLDHQEVGKCLGLRPGTSKSQYKKAKAWLKTELIRLGVRRPSSSTIDLSNSCDENQEQPCATTACLEDTIAHRPDVRAFAMTTASR